MSVTELLQHSELFSGLTAEQVERIVALGHEATYSLGDIVIHEGDPSDEVYIICSGMVEVGVSRGARDTTTNAPERSPMTSLARLGRGQVFGEIALVDRGTRSATVRCVKDGTVLYVIPRQSFWALCDGDHDIGYIVMRNIAADLAFKLRHRNLRVRLTGGEL